MTDRGEGANEGPIGLLVMGKLGAENGDLLSHHLSRMLVSVLFVTIYSVSSFMSAQGMRMDPWLAAFCLRIVFVSLRNSSDDVMHARWAARAARRVEWVG